MNLLIFGASGGTGRELVQQALAQGHQVTAFVRNVAKLDIQHENLKRVAGDINDSEALQRIVPGHDAAFSTLGSRSLQPDPELVKGIRAIVQAMEQSDVRRLVYESALGVGNSKDQVSFLVRYLVIPLVLKNAIADHEQKEAAIQQSQLDWVIVRPAGLTDGPRTGVYQHGDPLPHKPLRPQISRADVADFMLKQASDRTYIHRTPGIEY